MSRKEERIFNKILEKNNLPECKTFIKHRNLTEFKTFSIERINPTHRIFLYGNLKNNNKKKKTSKSLIKVGEILLVVNALMVNFDLFFKNIDFILLCFSMFFLTCFIFYLFSYLNILREFYDYWNRRIYGRWENCLYGQEHID